MFEKHTGEQPHLFLPRDPAPYVVESMDVFGFAQDRWSQLPEEDVTVERLIVPTHRSPEHLISYFDHPIVYDLTYKAVAPSACEWVRKEAENRLHIDTSTKTERLLILRNDADLRRIVNRNEVINCLSQYNFRPVTLSELQMKEQIELFATAEAVVAPHGAGLANLIFASDCTVFELFGKKIKPTYFMLSESANLEYHALRCKPNGRDMDVDVDQLESYVNCL